MAALSSSSSHLLRSISRPPQTPRFYSLLSVFFVKPLPFRSQTTPLRIPSSSSSFFFTSLSSSSSPSLSLSSSPSPRPPLHSLSHSNSETLLHIDDQQEHETVEESDDYVDDGDQFETENEDIDSAAAAAEEQEEQEQEEEETVSAESSNASVSEASNLLLPNLSVKEKKELASYAHSLGKKLKSQQVGKSGVTDSVAIALIETLEANELLKIKIHSSCPGELDEVVKHLEKATGSLVVGQIGRTVILYRPSLTKLKAEEKRRQVRRVYVRKQPSRPPLPNKGQPPRFSGRGRRGSSRVPSMSGTDFP